MSELDELRRDGVWGDRAQAMFLAALFLNAPALLLASALGMAAFWISYAIIGALIVAATACLAWAIHPERARRASRG